MLVGENRSGPNLDSVMTGSQVVVSDKLTPLVMILALAAASQSNLMGSIVPVPPLTGTGNSRVPLPNTSVHQNRGNVTYSTTNPISYAPNFQQPNSSSSSEFAKFKEDLASLVRIKL